MKMAFSLSVANEVSFGAKSRVRRLVVIVVQARIVRRVAIRQCLIERLLVHGCVQLSQRLSR